LILNLFSAFQSAICTEGVPSGQSEIRNM